ncbi:UPF0149 family protein [Paucibacter sp. XJ19-41]|uniref:UPF0149 family protein n=1 Tax=Paucibacter sp. XJ19-41 TaxID=2927824 RepID=UPI00234A0E7F|nr:UPF0149 family protein [Paucibacter sp. XJ19-41]MDC6168887.1 UPF0149 family protein [Paucibacter sp. XJ19-41]
MTDDDFELIHSPLTRAHSAEGHTLHIQIYRGAGEPWILEIVDELGTSTVWDDGFDTDTAALEAAFLAIETEGVHSFVTSAQQAAKEAEPEMLRRLAAGQRAPVPADLHDMMRSLSDEELDELERFLLDLDAEECMTLDRLDGFLHALAIGPETVMPNQWLPKVWGQADGAMLPPVDSMDQANQLLGLVMRHFNSIVSGFEHSPPVLAPFWPTVDYGATGEFEDAEMWAYGFTEGVKLSQAAWQALFEHPDGPRWYRPIGLLGADAFSADQDELTRTPEQRAALAMEIEESLMRIHAFWLPLRHAVAERRQARRMGTKVGRNDPCPCGSGKKFKKCCGAPSELH